MEGTCGLSAYFSSVMDQLINYIVIFNVNELIGLIDLSKVPCLACRPFSCLVLGQNAEENIRGYSGFLYIFGTRVFDY